MWACIQSITKYAKHHTKYLFSIAVVSEQVIKERFLLRSLKIQNIKLSNKGLNSGQSGKQSFDPVAVIFYFSSLVKQKTLTFAATDPTFIF